MVDGPAEVGSLCLVAQDGHREEERLAGRGVSRWTRQRGQCVRRLWSSARQTCALGDPEPVLCGWGRARQDVEGFQELALSWRPEGASEDVKAGEKPRPLCGRYTG